MVLSSYYGIFGSMGFGNVETHLVSREMFIVKLFPIALPRAEEQALASRG